MLELVLEDVDVEVTLNGSTSKAVDSCLLGGVEAIGLIPVPVLMLEDETTEVSIFGPPSEALVAVLPVVVAAKISLLRVLRCVASAEGVSVRVVATKKRKKTFD